jgi:hypothetical protein
LTRPQRLYQLLISELESDFPPLKTLDNRPTNLHAQPNPLFGRQRELQEVGAILRRNDVRLLTLTGGGGTGKTRLGLQIGADLLDAFSDGVFFVSLAAIMEPELVPATIARTLSVRERTGQSQGETLIGIPAGERVASAARQLRTPEWRSTLGRGARCRVPAADSGRYEPGPLAPVG